MSKQKHEQTASANGSILDVDGLDVTFSTDGGDVHAVKDVSLSVSPGEVLAIVGESGSGKTVTARSILGLLPETAQRSGAIVISGQNVLSVSADKLRAMRGRDVAMVFQEPSTALNPVFTVGWQIAEGLRAHDKKASKADLKARVVKAMRQVGIPDAESRFDYYPHQFSGGQKQRIVIAMALALGAKLIVADEPTTALDVTVQAEILDLLRELRDETGTAIVLITHNMGVVADLADRVAVMLRGDLVEEGPVSAVLERPQHEYTKMLMAAVPDLAGRKTIGDGAAEAKAVAEADEKTHILVSAGEKSGDSETERTDADGAAPSVRDGGGEAPSVTAPLLEVKDVALAYGKTQILDGINLTLEPGECTMLLGESGSGKTTLSQCVAGLNDDYKGSVRLRGTELARSTRKRTNEERVGIQYVFQSPFSSLNPRRSIGQSLTVPLEMSGQGTAASRKAAVEEALDSVRLGRTFYHRRPGDLSGGERQRAAIARALVNAPSVMVCDEITSALDVSVQASIVALLRSLREERQLAMLFVTHNIALSRHIADNLAVLNKGKIVDYGPTASVLEDPSHEYTRALIADVPKF